MRHELRSLAALVTVALIGAGCANGAAENGDTGNAGTKGATSRDEAVRFAECMRENGARAFPDPDASGELTIDGVLNGSSLDPSDPTWKEAIAACKDLQPAGFTGDGDATPSEQEVRLQFAQCMRDNGIEDFPDPTPDGPLIDTSRMPGSPGALSIPGFKAASDKCAAVYSGELGLP